MQIGRIVFACLVMASACDLAGDIGGTDEGALRDDHLEAPPPPQRAPDGSGSITPVLFVPVGQSVSQGDIDAVKQGLCDLEAWYERELGDKSLRLTPLTVLNGQKDAAHYRTTDNIWKEGPGELEAALGYSPWTPGHIVLLIGAGLLGWAGGAGNGQSGFAVIGLESLTNNAACGSEWWCNPTVWRGTAIHELGHALTLPHSAEPSIMNFHGDYQSKTLLDTPEWPEKTTVKSLPFVEDLAADAGMCGLTNWSACSSDGQCKSGWCGCNGGSDMVCLPDPSYPKDCAGSLKANWEGCSSDGECQSSWCGCNGGDTMVCLPSTDYPKDCVSLKSNWEGCSSDGECLSSWCGCNGGRQMVCLPNTDYPKDCSNGGSCLGQCGLQSGSCWCDSACASYGDCCPDKVAVCGP